MIYDAAREGPSYRLLSSKHVVARKDYVCAYCNEVIPKGAAHERVAAMADDKFLFERLHAKDPQYCPKWMREEPAPYYGEGADDFGLDGAA